MEISNINLVYFSATYTTKKILKQIAGQFDCKITEYDITQAPPEQEIYSGKNDLLIVGAPVYAGRIPAMMPDILKRFKSDGAPAIVVCVYGNRDYDDALLELKDIVQENGFKVVSAAAFIAQHSIFPQVGHGRPDEKDKNKITEFADKSMGLLKSISDVNSLPDIKIGGNRPYKTPGSIPLQPSGDKKCNECGTCVDLCPEQAIPENSPRKTIKEKCISCGRCIVVCPQDARHFEGMLYKMAGEKFVKANSEHKEPEIMFV